MVGVKVENPDDRLPDGRLPGRVVLIEEGQGEGNSPPRVSEYNVRGWKNLAGWRSEAKNAWFAKLPSDGLLREEVALLGAFKYLADAARALLPYYVSVEEWVEHRLPDEAIKTVNSTGLLHIKGRHHQGPPCVEVQSTCPVSPLSHQISQSVGSPTARRNPPNAMDILHSMQDGRSHDTSIDQSAQGRPTINVKELLKDESSKSCLKELLRSPNSVGAYPNGARGPLAYMEMQKSSSPTSPQTRGSDETVDPDPQTFSDPQDILGNNPFESSESFFASLPEEELTEAEERLRLNLCRIIMQKGAMPLAQAIKHGEVWDARIACLPQGVGVREWIRRRIGSEIETYLGDRKEQCVRLGVGFDSRTTQDPMLMSLPPQLSPWERGARLSSAFFQTLPKDELKPSEVELFNALVDFLESCRKTGKLATVTRSSMDPEVQRCSMSLLPRGVPLASWIALRVGDRIETTFNETRQCTILSLREDGNPTPKLLRRSRPEPDVGYPGSDKPTTIRVKSPWIAPWSQGHNSAG